MNFSYQKEQVLVLQKTEELVTSAATLRLALLSLSVSAYKRFGSKIFPRHFSIPQKNVRGLYSFICLLMFFYRFSGGAEKRIETFHDIYILNASKAANSLVL